MFFCIRHDLIPFPLRGIISQFGDALFVGSDLAKILRQKNTSQFVLRNATVRVKHVFRENLGFSRSVWKTWLFGFREATSLLKKSKIFACRLLGEQLENEMSRVVVLDETLLLEPHPTKLCRAKIVPKSEDNERGEMSLEDYIKKFTASCLELYDRSTRDKKAEKKEAEKKLHLHYYEDDFEVLQIKNAPTSVKIHFGNDKVFEYRLV